MFTYQRKIAAPAGLEAFKTRASARAPFQLDGSVAAIARRTFGDKVKRMPWHLQMLQRIRLWLRADEWAAYEREKSLRT